MFERFKELYVKTKSIPIKKIIRQNYQEPQQKEKRKEAYHRYLAPGIHEASV